MSGDLPDGGDDSNDPDWAKQLRKQNKDLERQLAERDAASEAAQRKLAFAEAGVPLSDPKSKYFVNGYDGELAVDAIKSEWGSFSGGAATAPPPDHSADIAAAQRITDAGTGAQSPDAQDEAARYRAELENLRNSSNRDPYVLQRQAEEIMAKYGSRVVGQ